MSPLITPGHPLRTLFAGLVEQVFMSDLGVCEPKLTAYLTGLLADFVHMDAIYRLRDVDRQVIRDLSRMEAEADLGDLPEGTARRRVVNQYIGDFTLFWTGVYPEQLRARRTSAVDELVPYLQVGKRSYGIASELTGPGDEPAADVLQQLSEHFELCVHGLHLIRANWEQLGASNTTN